MEEVPDEILGFILSFLPLTERLRKEAVCSRFLDVMPYERMRHLDLVKVLFPGKENRMDTIPVTSALQSLLRRCGEHVERISFGNVYLLVTPVTLNLVSKHCPNIRELDLSYCTITDSLIPALFPFCDRLEVLELGNTSFSIRDSCSHADNMFRLFRTMRRLKKLNLQRTSVQNFAALPCISPTIQSINLNQCGPLRPSLLLDFFLEAGRDLEELFLSAYGSLDETLLDTICGISSLKVLDLSHLAFSDLLSRENLSGLDFSGLAALTRLESLYLQYNNAIKDDVLRAVCRACVQLRVLNLAYNRCITDFTPLASLTGLNTLIVAATERFTDRDLVALSENAHLRVFKATNCPRLGGHGLEALLTSPAGPFLTDLSLTGQWEAESVTDDLSHRLLTVCRKLETLALHGCDNLTDGGVSVLSFPPKLRCLDLSFCSELTDEAVSSVNRAMESRNCPELTFYVHQTKVTRAKLGKIVPSLKVIL